MADLSEQLLETVRDARRSGQRIFVLGSGSKRFLTRGGGEPVGALLAMEEHTGIDDYRPDELVITVRAGTPLKEVREAVAREGQMLAFEPPEFRGLGTIGGAVAAGLAGPGRPWRGGVRDSVLGVQMINGLGERLSFGGQVMKNVAGFDVSRLQAGAFGTFGVLLGVSLKLLPLPHSEQTLALEMDRSDAHEQMIRLGGLPVPLTGSVWLEGRLYLRLSGAEPAVRTAARRLGGEALVDNALWSKLRDHDLPFFRREGLACRQVPPAAPVGGNDQMIDWNGARRWMAGEPAPEAGAFRTFGAGYARFRCRDAGGDRLLAEYQRRLKNAFDPDHLFNGELTDADVAA